MELAIGLAFGYALGALERQWRATSLVGEPRVERRSIEAQIAERRENLRSILSSCVSEADVEAAWRLVSDPEVVSDALVPELRAEFDLVRELVARDRSIDVDLDGGGHPAERVVVDRRIYVPQYFDDDSSSDEESDEELSFEERLQAAREERQAGEERCRARNEARQLWLRCNEARNQTWLRWRQAGRQGFAVRERRRCAAWTLQRAWRCYEGRRLRPSRSGQSLRAGGG